MKKLRRKFGKWLVSVGMKLYGTMPETVNSTEVKTVLNIPHDAVVEADDTPDQWAPEQHGNVVIVEPDLVTQFRRGKL